MKQFDLIPNKEKLETLFVMESPYKNEVFNNIPCTGESGKVMAEKIFGDSNYSIGEILMNNIHPDSGKYGIMNAFPFPLEIVENLNEEQKKYTHLKSISWSKDISRKEFYDRHFEIIKETKNLEYYTSFKSRLRSYLTECPNLKNLVFNGYISQSVYLVFKNLTNEAFPYNKKISQVICNFKVSVLFVNHPSKKNEKWDFNI